MLRLIYYKLKRVAVASLGPLSYGLLHVVKYSIMS